MPYDPMLVAPMREELTRLGVQELLTAGEVDDWFGDKDKSGLLVINSVCGCAAGQARPSVALALDHAIRPDRVAMQDATAQMAASSVRRTTTQSDLRRATVTDDAAASTSRPARLSSSGRVVVAHAGTAEGMRRATLAGVKTIEHGDGGTAAGDGCSDTCQVEPGWQSSGSPSTCQPPPSRYCRPSPSWRPGPCSSGLHRHIANWRN